MTPPSEGPVAAAAAAAAAATAMPPCGLETLPAELIRKIVDHLPVYSVLLLLSLRKPGSYLHLCLLDHPLYWQVFVRQETLTAVRDLFVLLYEVATATHSWPVDVLFLDHGHGHDSLLTDSISGCGVCLDLIRKGLSHALMQKATEIVESLDVKTRGNCEGYEVVSLTMLPVTGSGKGNRGNEDERSRGTSLVGHGFHLH